jgi:hypothetical protein
MGYLQYVKLLLSTKAELLKSTSVAHGALWRRKNILGRRLSGSTTVHPFIYPRKSALIAGAIKHVPNAGDFDRATPSLSQILPLARGCQRSQPEGKTLNGILHPQSGNKKNRRDRTEDASHRMQVTPRLE